MLQGEIRSLAHEKHRLQVRIRQLREQVLPKAQEKAARTLVAIEAEAQVVRNRQAMVSDRIEFLQGKASLTPEEQLELTNLQTENRDLSRTLERLDRSKALCNDVVRDVERDIAELEAKINTVNTALSLLKSERAGLIRKISVAQGSEPAARNEERASSRRTHSRSSLSEGRTSAEQDIVVATADAGGGGGEGEEGGSQGGSPDGRRSWNPFAWFSGHKEDKEAVRASADSRISYQVGNMPGDNVGEQYERVLEEANYIRSA
jgi:chromosome segregation ATPase